MVSYEKLQTYATLIQNNPSIKAAFPKAKRFILYENQITSEENRQTMCKETFASTPTVIYTVKDFWLLEEINEKIELFKAAGFMEFWYYQFIDRKKTSIESSQNNPKILSLLHFQGCFAILLSGFAVSILAFVLEIMGKIGEK